MDEITIVGGGFSAFLAKLMLGERASVISASASINLEPHQIQRRSIFEANKFFAKKSYSASRLKPTFD